MTLKGQKRYTPIWGHPDFHALLKVEAAKNNMSLYDLTFKIARERKEVDSKPEKDRIKRGEWDFGF